MTVEPPTAAAEHGGDRTDDGVGARADLSDAFGRPAAASLRDLLPPRPRGGADQGAASTAHPRDRRDATREPERRPQDGTPEDGVREDGIPQDGVPDDGGPAAADEEAAARPERRRAAAPPRVGRAAARPSPAGITNRRWGPVRMAAREHVELVVLVALSRGPADGREVAARLRADSAGGLAPPPTSVQRTLHHLVRHGLAERVTEAGGRQFRLTEPGTRVARARVRSWQALRRAVDAVIDSAGDG